MPRLTPIDPATATGEARELLDGIQAAFGMTPNSFRAMANNPGVLKGWIELSSALGTTLPRKLCEQIAIAIAEQNRCAYCLSAHAAVAGLLGIDADRKSTRLNSSHLGISYAVFCLKKKKKTNTSVPTVRKRKYCKSEMAELHSEQ